MEKLGEKRALSQDFAAGSVHTAAAVSDSGENTPDDLSPECDSSSESDKIAKDGYCSESNENTELGEQSLRDEDLEASKQKTSRKASDEALCQDIHDFHRQLESGDVEGLLAALKSPELFRTACDDERYLKLAFQGISVLAWHDPAEASSQLERYDIARSRELEGSAGWQAAAALMAAVEWRYLTSNKVEPVCNALKLRDFLMVAPALGHRSRAAMALREELEQEPSAYLPCIQALLEQGHVLPRWIFHLHLGFSPEDEKSQVELSDEQKAGTLAVVESITQKLGANLQHLLLWLAVIVVVVLLPNALGALLSLLLIGLSFAWREGRSYRELVRPELISLAAKQGVGASALVHFLYQNPRQSGRLGSFDIKIENDRILDLLAAVNLACTKGVASTISPSEVC